jgi:hypothetical protein
MIEDVQVVIADAHTLFRDGLKALLASTSDVDVAGEVATGDDAVALRVGTNDSSRSSRRNIRAASHTGLGRLARLAYRGVHRRLNLCRGHLRMPW